MLFFRTLHSNGYRNEKRLYRKKYKDMEIREEVAAVIQARENDGLVWVLALARERDWDRFMI